MGFDKDPVPSRCLRARRQRRTRGVVARLGAAVARACRVVNEIAEALPEPCVVPAVLGHNLEIEMLTEVELSDESLAMIRLVADPGTANRRIRATAGDPSRRRKADHGVRCAPLH